MTYYVCFIRLFFHLYFHLLVVRSSNVNNMLLFKHFSKSFPHKKREAIVQKNRLQLHHDQDSEGAETVRRILHSSYEP